MAKDIQKQTLKLLDDFISSLESVTEAESIESNPRALLHVLHLERVADYCDMYPDDPGNKKLRKNRKKQYPQLESLRVRIAELSERLPEEKRKEILTEFNDTTSVTSMIKGGFKGAEDVPSRSKTAVPADPEEFTRRMDELLEEKKASKNK